jgi:RND family efflux transporter MFP subunit
MIRKLIVIAIFTIYGFAADGKPALVNTVKVVKGVVNPLEEFIGTLQFSNSSDLASQTSGMVKKINFEAGDFVKKGDILVQIDSDILEAKLSSAKAAYEIAKIKVEDGEKDYKRYQKLLEKKSISQKIYDDSFVTYKTALQNLDAAKANLDQLKIEKEHKTILAPYSGSIVTKNIDLGEWVSVGKTVASLVDRSSADLIFNLPTSYVYKLDKEISYSVKLGEKELDSKLYAAIAKGDVRTRTFPVKFKANITNSFIFEGMEVKIKLPRAKKIESLIVPRDAVIKRFGGDVIFINSDSKAMMLPVQITGYEKNNVAIEAKGLMEGMDVVVKGNERIFPNQPLQSLNK